MSMQEVLAFKPVELWPLEPARKEAKQPKVDKDLYKQTLALQIREYMRLNGLSQEAACARALGLTAARVSQLLKEN